MEKLNMKKFPLRLLGAILAALLVLAVFPISALAEDGIELVLDVYKETAIEGNEVTVTVKIGGSNSGIASMCFDLEYDKDVFALKENSAEILGNFKTNSGSLELMEERQEVYNLEAISPQDGTVTFNWIYSGALNSGLNGAQDCTLSNVAFAKLVFTVNKGVTENKDINFVLKPSEENIFSIKDNMPSVPVSGYTSEKTIVKSVTVKKSYTVTYNANGGTGALEAQKKVDGEPLTLSETVPTYTGYKFLGWATSQSATEAEYRPGETYSDDEALELFAVWQKRAENVKFTVSDGSGVAGGKVSVDLSLSFDSGTLVADKIELPLIFTGLSNVTLSDNTWTYSGGKLTWNGTAKEFEVGKLLTLTFDIPSDAVAGTKYTVSIGDAKVSDSTYNYSPLTSQNGTVTVISYILGDVNGDGQVNSSDASLVLQYAASFPVSINTVAGDVNGDGNVNSSDASLILQYAAQLIPSFPINK